MGPLRWIAGILLGAWSLLKGMGVTIREFFSRDVTQQYPNERWRVADRFRGRVDLPLDPVSGSHKCTLCMLCVRACPNGSLEIVAGKGTDGRTRVLEKYIYKLGTCTLCELCVEACNFDAIRMNHDYELSTYDRQSLTLVLNEPARSAGPGAAGRP